jgi:hypothetical protein
MYKHNAHVYSLTYRFDDENAIVWANGWKETPEYGSTTVESGVDSSEKKRML